MSVNHLEKLKSRLQIKPKAEDREKVVVRLNINGTEPAPNKESTAQPTTLIVDRTKEAFDRDAVLKKWKQKQQATPILKAKANPAEEVSAVVPQKTPTPAPKRSAPVPLFIIEEEDENEGEKGAVLPPPPKEADIVVQAPKPTKRRTKKPVKGVAVLGPEVVVDMGDTEITARMPRRSPPVNIKVSSYVMNNREIFVNFINSLFQPYKREMEENTDMISCDTIGKTTTQFSLLTHQKIVRDYLNLYTPYRGLLLYHGLGSGKTCTSIGIAEGMKSSKRVIIMTPASLRANYMGELKKCGDLLYKKHQYWEWISTDVNPTALPVLSAVLNLPQEYIEKRHGAFFVNVKKPPNIDSLSDTQRQVLDEQLNEMIRQKYTFINYNGLREKRLAEMTSQYSKNLFDDAVVLIDEAHNFISRIVNKLKKEKPIKSDKRGVKERLPISLAVKLYEMLLSAKNARVVLLTGTPVINYPNEFAILFNILRGYIKTWNIPLEIHTSQKIDRHSLQEMLLGEKTMDYLDYSPSSKILTITRNPFGFKNKIKKESGYQGVANSRKNEKGEWEIEPDVVSDDDFERRVMSILKRNDIDVVSSGIEIKYMKALPDQFDEFVARYIDTTDRKLKNTDALKRRILGLSSYFRSAQENLLPKFNKTLGVDYHIVRMPMSDVQFRLYEAARKEERIMEKPNKSASIETDYEDKASTYRIFSRLICNYAIPDRPIPIRQKKKDDKADDKADGDAEDGEKKGAEQANKDNDRVNAIKEGQKIERKQDITDDREGEIEGDEVLEQLGGTTYMERLKGKLREMNEHADEFFSPDALATYSPKFLNIIENIKDAEYAGLHLVYSQFRTAEGIGLLTLALNHNGFAEFKIKKTTAGTWTIDIAEKDLGKPTYALYTGTETVEEKEIVRKIYNGEWDDIPESISVVLKAQHHNNNMGEVIKVFMITSSGSEGINLRNTRYVHLMDPYWHPVRAEQVIGRARRICSHKDLPLALQTVEVFVYLMILSDAQLQSDEVKELKKKDLSKSTPRVPITSDQYLFEISELKANLTSQLTEAIKESAFDCYLYSSGKCVNFGDPTIQKFSYVPDYSEQQNDTTVQANKRAIEWVGKPIEINGVKYIYRRVSSDVLKIYDRQSYENALKDSSIVPVQIGTLEKNERGENVFKELVK